jgi:hypothetical protein
LKGEENDDTMTGVEGLRLYRKGMEEERRRG